MFYWIYDIPTATFAALATGLAVAVYWVGAVLLRPILRQFVKRTSGANDVVGYVLSCFCVFYGLLLGLIAVTAYQNAADTGANVTREAAALSALYEDVSRYREPYGQNLRWLLRDYTRYVIKYAWPLQQRADAAAGQVALELLALGPAADLLLRGYGQTAPLHRPLLAAADGEGAGRRHGPAVAAEARQPPAERRLSCTALIGRSASRTASISSHYTDAGRVDLHLMKRDRRLGLRDHRASAGYLRRQGSAGAGTLCSPEDRRRCQPLRRHARPDAIGDRDG
jgi:hypothetical protein